ncbi:response regulator [Bacillus benzoevorans]|uniref:Two-component system chemotaxis response regulator CheY n=1 Tax=Bacillus benzoevorans TaxID=1456 RepID=A0A7X0HQN5_9BACI|nr:response regulator [Bacillus benzoevorans]MBB6445162.1 two-component system chemotaxis response regulator CheY [Bacillus benzoevorans]
MAKILITDDAAFMRMQLRDMLTKLGHEVVGEAGNGQEAVIQYQNLKPEIVTMDITMPEMNGIEAVKEIKKLHADAKIIMCSAMGQQGMVVEAIKAGATDFIVKPFNMDRIKEAIEKVM